MVECIFAFSMLIEAQHSQSARTLELHLDMAKNLQTSDFKLPWEDVKSVFSSASNASAVVWGIYLLWLRSALMGTQQPEAYANLQRMLHSGLQERALLTYVLIHFLFFFFYINTHLSTTARPLEAHTLLLCGGDICGQVKFDILV